MRNEYNRLFAPIVYSLRTRSSAFVTKIGFLVFLDFLFGDLASATKNFIRASPVVVETLVNNRLFFFFIKFAYDRRALLTRNDEFACSGAFATNSGCKQSAAVQLREHFARAPLLSAAMPPARCQLSPHDRRLYRDGADCAS